MRKLLYTSMVLLSMAACRPTTPSQYIQPDKMEELLVDFHRVRAIAAQEGGSYDEQSLRKALYWKAAQQKHGVTQEQFDSSLIYYYTRADRFSEMYKHVLNRLQDEAVLMGASEGEIGRYASLNATGDTANIWPYASTHMLIPSAPYQRYEFCIDVDTLFRAGDTFLMQFVSDFVYQNGTKDGLLYVAIDYPDTVIVRQSRFSYSGVNQLRIPNLTKTSPKAVKGYFYLGGSADITTTLRMLFINSIQLIRFHSQDEPEKTITTSSFTPADATKRTTANHDGSSDTVRTRGKVLSNTRGRTPNRMVERIDSLKARH